MLGIFLLVGGLSWWTHLRPELEFDASSLASLPSTIDGFTSRDLPIDEGVESMLDANFNIQREYRTNSQVIWLYVGYYSTERGGKPEHLPSVCYGAHGWQIIATRQVSIDEARGWQAQEYVIEQGNEQRLVHFWFRSSHSSGILRLQSLQFDHLLNRLAQGRADGSLVRLSTPLRGGRDLEARKLLLSFAVELETMLGEHWPSEFPAGSTRNASASD